MSATNLELPYSIDPKNPFLVDKRSGPWASVNAANAGIPETVRVRGLVVIVLDAVVGYYYKDGVADVNLVPINTDESAIWGQITGVLSNQTDLQAALDVKEDDITPGTTLQFWRGDKTWQTLNTAVVPESGSLYFTEARARAAISLTTTGNNGAATYTGGVFNIPVYSLAGLGGEPAIAAGTNLQYWRGDKTWQTLNTDAVPEATAKYYTDARVLAYGNTQWARLDGSYTNPSWLVSLPWSKITNTPTTLGGYGITDAFTETEADARFVKKAGDTMSGNLLIAAPASIDSSLVPGEDILNLGTANASVINIGWSGATINIQGSVMWQDVDNLAVTDKLIRLNKGGAAASGVSSGFEIEENAVITGWLATDSTRTGWDFKAPASQQLTLGLDLLTAGRTIKMPNLTGTLLIDSGTYNDPAWLATLAWSKITGTPTTLSGYGITNAYTKTETDSLLSAYTPMTRQLTINGVTQDLLANRTWNVGTVTSVGLAVPTGFTSGAAVSSSGNLTLGFDAGYSLPTNVKQGQWDTAFGWGNWAAGSHYIGTTLIANNRASGAQTLTGVSIDGNAATATTFSTTRANYKGVTDGAVVGQLMWKEYGNNHTIFDASDGTAPDGTTVSTTNSAVPWAATYPTLMGWNGSTTYGVRVDSARVAGDSSTLQGYYPAASATANTIALRDGNGYLRAVFFYDDNTSVVTTGMTSVYGGTGDRYMYKFNASAVQTFLGLGSAAYTASSAYYAAGSTVANSTLWNGYAFSFASGTPSHLIIWDGSTFKLAQSAAIQSFLGLGSYAYRSSGLAELSGANFVGLVQMTYQASINTTTPGTATYGLHFGGQTTSDFANGITWNGGSGGAQAGIYVQGSGSYGTKMYLATTNNYTTGAISAVSIDHVGLVNFMRTTPTVQGNVIYHAGNFTPGSYVPYTGATGHLQMGGWNVYATTFVSDGYYSAGVVPMMVKDATYVRLYRGNGNIGIYLGGTDASNYYDNTTHYIRNSGGGSNYAVIESAGLTAYNMVQAYNIDTVNRTTYRDVLVVTANATSLPYLGHGGGILFRGSTYQNNGSNITYARIGAITNSDSSNAYGSTMFFDIATNSSGSIARAFELYWTGRTKWFYNAEINGSDRVLELKGPGGGNNSLLRYSDGANSRYSTGYNNGNYIIFDDVVNAYRLTISSAGDVTVNTGGFGVTNGRNFLGYTSPGLSYTQATLEVYSSGSYGPRISLHYGGVVASQIGIEGSGRIAALNNPGTSYENFIANNIWAAAHLYVGGNIVGSGAASFVNSVSASSFAVGEMILNSNQLYRNSSNEMYLNYSGGGNTMLGNSSGNVSINAGTNPLYRLHIGGTLGVTSDATFLTYGTFGTRTRVGGGYITDISGTGNNSGIAFGASGIYSVDGGGSYSSTKDLGYDSLPWRSAYLSGAIRRTNPLGGYLNGGYAGIETTTTPGLIYAISDSYLPTASALSAMYGVGYTHSSFAGDPMGAGGTWGFYMAAAGTMRHWLGQDAYRSNVPIVNTSTSASSFSGNITAASVSISSGGSLGLVSGDIWIMSNSGFGILSANAARLVAIQNGQMTVQGILQMGAYPLGFNENGVRSWATNATGGNLVFNSGDGLGSHIFNTAVTVTRLDINHNGGGINLNRAAVTNYVGLYYKTANLSKWFVGMRENLAQDNYVIYNENGGYDALRIASSGGAATFSGQINGTSLSMSGGITGGNYFADNISANGSGRIELKSGGTRFGALGTGNWALADGTTDLVVYAEATKSVKIAPNGVLGATFSSTGLSIVGASGVDAQKYTLGTYTAIGYTGSALELGSTAGSQFTATDMYANGSFSSRFVSGKLLVNTTTNNGTDALQVAGSGLFTSNVQATANASGRSGLFGGASYGVRIDNSGSFNNGGSTIHGVDNTFVASYQKLSLNGSSLEFMTDYGTRLTIASSGAATFSSSVQVNGSTSLRNTNIRNINQNISLTLQADGSNTYLPTIAFGNGDLSGYYAYLQANNAGSTALEIYSNTLVYKNINTSTTHFSIGTTGAATFSSSVTATSDIATGSKFRINGSGAAPTASALEIGTNGVGSRLLYNVPTGGEHNLTVNGTTYWYVNASGVGTSSSVTASSFIGAGTGLTGYASAFGVAYSYRVEPAANYGWSQSTTPTGYSSGIQSSFVSSAQGWPDYGSVLNMKTYSGGGGSLQMYIPYSPNYGGTRVRVRFGNYDAGDVWTGWKMLLSDATDPYAYNMNQYVRTTDNVTFNQVTATLIGVASQVTVNYNNDSNSTYQMLWGSGNSVYGTAGIYCNPNTDWIYAARFSETSDRTLKEVITENILVPGIENITPHLYKKKGAIELGYFAQDVQPYLPHAVTVGNNGKLTLTYRDVFAAKIYSVETRTEKLERRVRELEAELSKLKMQ